MAKVVAPRKRAIRGVLCLKVTLRDTSPPVWRRILMPGGRNLYDLHMAIQVTMGWMDSHLHAFKIGGQQYGDTTRMDDVADEDRLTLNGIVKSGVSRFRYTYDFGDNWEHDVVIEKVPPGQQCDLVSRLHWGQAPRSARGLRRDLGLCRTAHDTRRPGASAARRTKRVDWRGF